MLFVPFAVAQADDPSQDAGEARRADAQWRALEAFTKQDSANGKLRPLDEFYLMEAHKLAPFCNKLEEGQDRADCWSMALFGYVPHKSK
jgi:hypothetical protein